MDLLEELLHSDWGTFTMGDNLYTKYETADTFLITLDLPGCHKKDISIQVKSGSLAISYKRKNHTDAAPFTKYVSIPNGVMIQDATSSYEDGVLTIRLPKQEKMKPTLIPVI